jgi:restriction endonuclease Mrr
MWAALSQKDIQKFVGALHGKHARKGVFITTGTFAQGAVDYASGTDPTVVLIDGKQLAELVQMLNGTAAGTQVVVRGGARHTAHMPDCES